MGQVVCLVLYFTEYTKDHLKKSYYWVLSDITAVLAADQFARWNLEQTKLASSIPSRSSGTTREFDEMRTLAVQRCFLLGILSFMRPCPNDIS